MTDPVAATQSLYYRGLADEKAGDVAAARAAYESVVTRWGSAKPTSVTAGLAKKRLAVLPR